MYSLYPHHTIHLSLLLKVHVHSTLVTSNNFHVENHVFSANQLAALRYQIMTFKLLAKNAPIPLNLQHAVLTPFHTLSSPATPTITKPFPQAKQQRKAQKYIPSPKSVTPTMVKSVANTPPVHGSYVPPFELLKKPISFHAHASKQQKTIIPSLLPTGIDPQNIISSREARILSRMRNSQTQDPRNIKQVIQRKAVQLIQKRDKVNNDKENNIVLIHFFRFEKNLLQECPSLLY